MAAVFPMAVTACYTLNRQNTRPPLEEFIDCVAAKNDRPRGGERQQSFEGFDGFQMNNNNCRALMEKFRFAKKLIIRHAWSPSDMTVVQ